MKQEDWTSRLRERLENHETPAPEGLWQQIESALPAGHKAKVTPLKKWITAAAAVMLVGGVGLGLLWKSDNSENVVARDVVNSVSDVFDNKSNSSSDDISNTDISDELVAQATSSKSENVRISVGNKYFIVSSQVVDGEPVGFSIKVEDKINEIQDVDEEYASMESRKENLQRSMRSSSMPLQQPPANNHLASNKRTHFYQRFSAGLAAGSVALVNSKSTTGVLMSPVMLSPYRDGGVAEGGSIVMSSPSLLPDFEEHIEHKAPLTLGLKLGYSITPRMWVESGVQYSKLSSTFVREMRGSELTSEQALHYVGVPLGVGYRIFDVGPLSFYGLAGAQADFNVKAKSSVEGVETDGVKDDVQFSANAALGAQVKITPHLGVYVEPGARYYFDNGSNVQNYFKDKKLNFNLQVGARWNIGGKK